VGWAGAEAGESDGSIGGMLRSVVDIIGNGAGYKGFSWQFSAPPKTG
jgi:hypothetical protein